MALLHSPRTARPSFNVLITDANYHWWVALPVMLGMFIVVMDSSIVNVALSHIMAAFGSNIEDIEWVSTGYMLSSAVMMPVSGFLSDRFGSKRVLAIATIAFTVTSVLCGMAWSTGSLIFFRVLQGIAGGVLQPVAQAVIFNAFPVHQRSIGTALVGIGAMFAPTVGPTLGGYLVENLDWRWIFFVNLVPGVATSLMVLGILRETEQRAAKFDAAGFILLASFLSTCLVALSQGTSKGWGSLYILSLWVISGVSFAFFLIVEFWRSHPVVALKVFKDRTYAAGSIATTIMGVGLYGGMFLLPLFLQNLMGYDGIRTGLLMLPQGLTLFLVMPLASLMMSRVDPRALMAAGLSMMGGSLILQAHMTPDTPVWLVAGWGILRGIGMGLAFPSMNQTQLDFIPPELVGQGTGLMNVMRAVGGSFGIAWLSTTLTVRQVFHTAILGQDAARTGQALSLLPALRAQFVARGAAPTLASQQASAVLGMAIHQQAVVLAFQDAFYVAGVAMLAGVLPCLFMRPNPLAVHEGGAMVFE